MSQIDREGKDLASATAKKKSWRDTLSVHPAAFGSSTVFPLSFPRMGRDRDVHWIVYTPRDLLWRHGSRESAVRHRNWLKTQFVVVPQ